MAPPSVPRFNNHNNIDELEQIIEDMEALIVDGDEKDDDSSDIEALVYPGEEEYILNRFNPRVEEYDFNQIHLDPFSAIFLFYICMTVLRIPYDDMQRVYVFLLEHVLGVPSYV
jgi:hypothetical protein